MEHYEHILVLRHQHVFCFMCSTSDDSPLVGLYKFRLVKWLWWWRKSELGKVCTAATRGNLENDELL